MAEAKMLYFLHYAGKEFQIEGASATEVGDAVQSTDRVKMLDVTLTRGGVVSIAIGPGIPVLIEQKVAGRVAGS